jgi:hypothetical protein
MGKDELRSREYPAVAAAGDRGGKKKKQERQMKTDEAGVAMSRLRGEGVALDAVAREV